MASYQVGDECCAFATLGEDRAVVERAAATLNDLRPTARALDVAAREKDHPLLPVTPLEAALHANGRAPLLRPRDVEALLAVSRRWVYQAAQDGRLPCVRLGSPDGPLRFDPGEIEAFILRSATWR